jgi:hypothetical protein
VNGAKRTRAGHLEGSEASRRAVRRFVAVVLTLAAVSALVWGLSRLGDSARRELGPRERYSIRFADIECGSPPGCDRSTFLAEVRYCSSFPEFFQALDSNLTTSLTAAFTVHPWVERVDSVSVESSGTVRVNLKFRTPVLAVPTSGETRIVDGNGVLLPKAGESTGLPELIAAVPAPTVPAGQVWADSIVQRAVELVAIHHPVKLEKTASGWRLAMADGRILVLAR